VSVVETQWLESVVLEESAINQQLHDSFHLEQLRLYSTITPFPVEWLTSQEQAFFATLQHPKRQNSWLLGRTLLKFLAFKQPTLVDNLTENNQETIEAWHFPHPHCSLSHTETTGYALINLNTASTQSIGLDVEKLTRKALSKKALAYLLSNEERTCFEQLSVESPNVRWDLHYWTGKEALYKATPAMHQGNIYLNRWKVSLALVQQVMGCSAQVQTPSGIQLEGQVFYQMIEEPVTYCLEGSRLISIALVQST
jgi:phosphopantetheinyl transferase